MSRLFVGELVYEDDGFIGSASEHGARDRVIAEKLPPGPRRDELLERAARLEQEGVDFAARAPIWRPKAVVERPTPTSANPPAPTAARPTLSLPERPSPATVLPPKRRRSLAEAMRERLAKPAQPEQGWRVLDEHER